MQYCRYKVKISHCYIKPQVSLALNRLFRKIRKNRLPGYREGKAEWKDVRRVNPRIATWELKSLEGSPLTLISGPGAEQELQCDCTEQWGRQSLGLWTTDWTDFLHRVMPGTGSAASGSGNKSSWDVRLTRRERVRLLLNPKMLGVLLLKKNSLFLIPVLCYDLSWIWFMFDMCHTNWVFHQH